MITVFGSVNIDLIGNVEKLPVPGETVMGRDFITAPGGKGANQALAAARAGGSVRFCGAIGDEANSAGPLQLLREAGVDLKHVRVVPGPTGTALILVEEGGNNVIAVFSAANMAVHASDASGLEFSEGDVLLLQMEVPVVAMIAVAHKARVAGATVVLNIAPFSGSVRDLIPLVDVLIVNETEFLGLARLLEIEEFGARPLSYDFDLEALARAVRKEVGADLVVTLGEKGATAITDQRMISVGAFAVDVVDAVAAGDTFCGALAARLDGDREITRDKLAFAAAAAGLACTRAGAQPSIPLLREIDRLMQA